MTNAALAEKNPDQSFLQSAQQVLSEIDGQSRSTTAGFQADTNDFSGSKPHAIAPLNEEDIAYIKAHGARAYAEELQKKIVEEIRHELLNLMGLTPESLSEVTPLQRQTIEGLIAVEIDARLSASLASDTTQTEGNSTYLKAMMLTQGNYGFFDEKPVTSIEDFNKRTAASS